MELESQQLVNTDARAQGVNDQSGYTKGNITLNPLQEKELYTASEYSAAITNLLYNCEYYVMQAVPTKTNGISEIIHTFIMTTFWKQGRLTIIFAACILTLLSLLVLFYHPIENIDTSILDFDIETKVLNITNFSVQDSSDAPIFYVNGTLQININDYVRPIKIQNVKLNSDDLLYESKRNKKDKDYISAYSVTGNFRSKSNQIWDPHPEYMMTVFGHKLHIVLHQDNSFVTPNSFRVIRIVDNTTEIQEEFQDHYLGCYYKGYVRGDKKSAVAMSLCNGMTGHIKTSFGSLLIEPVENAANTDNLILHKVWRHSKRHSRHIPPVSLDIDSMGEMLSRKLIRKRRNYVDKHLYTMEVLVAVDRTMIEFHNDDLRSYILTLISIVSNIFSDASIGNSIYISVSNILILNDDIVATSGKKSIAASQLLKHFCLFLRKKGIPYDTALMLTRDQICRNERETRCDTLGLAELGTICKRYSCSIVQDNGLPAAFTIAHELGHILNMPHDDDTRCDNFKQYGRNTLHIMSSTMGDDIHPWSWSDCSRHYVSEFLEKEDTTCLEDTPQTSITTFNAKLPGEMYSLDQQCKLIHGNHSRNCSIEGECARLWCTVEPNRSDCRSSFLPWADGTPCGKKTHWCQKGICTPREGTKRHVINGGWGPWSSFTACSMTCGGGVQESLRECNNPFPQNGGKYCGGSRKKYRSCNTQSCPAGSLDSREQQCYDMNGNNFGLKGINGSVMWLPKYGLTGRDKCKLYCRIASKSQYFQLADKVKDGTTCSFDSFDKCVNGICRPAGCDNELNSMAVLDKCGVCEGRNNTCEEYTGNLYRSDLSNKTNSLYYYVTTIPKGSSNIVITQPDYLTQNYIVLRDPDGNSLLNGDRVINTYRFTFFYGGLSFEYNGSKSFIERVNTTYSRKLKKDLIVEIISLDLDKIKNDTILLTYTYTADKPLFGHKIDSYQWEVRGWSPCNALCQGTSTQVVSCVNIESGLKVAPPFCDSTTKPRAVSKLCNTNCHLTINVSSISECSAQCGMLGRREKTLLCVQTFVDENRQNIVPLSRCETKFEISAIEQCSEGCWNYTSWSPCSATCGTGRQERGVACYLNGTRVDDSLCDARKRSSYNDNIRLCPLKACTDWLHYEERQSRGEHYWNADNWSECDNNCEKTRTVTCSIGHKCAIEKKPIEKKKCCAIKYVAEWSPCSVECGSGTRKKEFYCARVEKSGEKGFPRKKVQIDSKYCSRLRVPTPRRSKKSCKINCKWATDNWSDCAHDCRSEYQMRNVSCVTGVKERPISTKYCEIGKKPVTKRMCSHCVRREIKFTKCNCEGFRRGRTICTDGFGKRIACPSKVKMIKEKCRPSEECLPRSCADIKRQKRIITDQEYTIFVKKKPKKIYCHNMNHKPKEYITLNPSENYSIYYSNKTKYSDICLSDQRYMVHKEDCTKYGRTRFRKIGIDINTLRVNEYDFTFAESVGSPQPYGSAGDCCSRNRECPQGDFSINISTTGFVIRFGTVWDKFGKNSVMKTSNGFEHSSTDRRAFCGGYCGRCAISSHAGLFLDV